MKNIRRLSVIALLLTLAACSESPAVEPISAPKPVMSIVAPPTRTPLPTHDPAQTPTPDATRAADTHTTELYIVQSGDTIASIAE